jgi:hypothetical protein
MSTKDLYPTKTPYKSVRELLDHPEIYSSPDAIGTVGWRGKVTLLPGREKSGKSSFIGYDAVQVAKQGLKVLWMPYEEDINQVVSRFVNLRVGEGDSKAKDFIWVADPCPPNDSAARSEYIASLQPDIVYVDTFASYLYMTRKSQGEIPDMSENVKWQAFMQQFKEWAQIGAGCAVVVLHHQNKQGSAHGSIGITAGADCIADFERSGKAQDIKRIEFRARFPLQDPRLFFRWDADAFAYMPLGNDESSAAERVTGSELRRWIEVNGPITSAAARQRFNRLDGTLKLWCKRHGLDWRWNPETRETEYYIVS